MLKKCVRCKLKKELSFFSARKMSKDGLQSKCKECKAAYEKELRLKNPERYKKYRRQNPNNKDYLFRYKHGFERKDALLILQQQGCCPICNEELTEEKGNWYIDHDHSCCKPLTSCEKCRRDILCRNCNIMLGLAKDNEQILASAIKYLAKHKEKKDANVRRTR